MPKFRSRSAGGARVIPPADSGMAPIGVPGSEGDPYETDDKVIVAMLRASPEVHELDSAPKEKPAPEPKAKSNVSAPKPKPKTASPPKSKQVRRSPRSGGTRKR